MKKLISFWKSVKPIRQVGLKPIKLNFKPVTKRFTSPIYKTPAPIRIQAPILKPTRFVPKRPVPIYKDYKQPRDDTRKIQKHQYDWMEKLSLKTKAEIKNEFRVEKEEKMRLKKEVKKEKKESRNILEFYDKKSKTKQPYINTLDEDELDLIGTDEADLINEERLMDEDEETI